MKSHSERSLLMKKAQKLWQAQFSQVVDLVAVCAFIVRIDTKEKKKDP